MLELLEHSLVNICKVSPTTGVLVGVSGGADSLGLLHGLYEIGIPVVAAHFEHGLREEGRSDALFVQAFCEEKGIRCVVGKGNTKAFAEQKQMSIEEAARELRYSFLFREAEQLGIKAIAVAHTADDQVETVLMHLLRGAGLDGLTGMRYRWVTPWHSEVILIRPLLNIWKAQVLEYCELHKIEPRFDRSNLDTTFYRNKIRHELIPFLAGFNPNASKLILQTANILANDQDYLQTIVEEIWRNLLLEKSESHLAFELDGFVDLHVAVRRRVLRKAVAELRPGLRDIGFLAIEQGLKYIRQNTGSAPLDFVANLFLQMEEDRVVIADWGRELVHPDYPQMLKDFYAIEKIPSKTTIVSGWVLSLKYVEMSAALEKEIYTNQNPYVAFLDSSGLSNSIYLRIRRDGDRFQPLGMTSSDVNLANFLINEKIPVRARKHWPLVCSGDSIVWLPGVRIDQKYRVTQDTKQILRVEFQKK